MLKTVFGTLALILAMSVFAGAQTDPNAPTYVIRGNVIIPSNRHVDFFEVLLMSRDNEQIVDHTNVDMNNIYYFANPSAGDYDIVVRLEGFLDSRTNIRVGRENSKAAVYDLNIFLTRKPDPNSTNDQEQIYSKAILEEYAKGMDEFGKGHLDLAEPHLKKVITQIPDFYDGHFNLGMVYQGLSRRTEAEKEYRTAHELNPDSARPLLALGRLFVEEADIEILVGSKPDVVQPKLNEARVVLAQAVALDGKLATGFYYLGAVDFRSASYVNAEKELKHALELDPKLSSARISLINVYVKQELWLSALDNIDLFLLEDRDSPFRQQVATTRIAVVRRLPAPK